MAAAVCSAPAAFAQGIYAEAYQAGTWTALPGFPSKAAGQAGLPSGSDIEIDLTTSATVRVYADNPASTDIGVVTLHAQPGLTPTLFIGKPASTQTSTSGPVGQIACRTLAGVHANEKARTQIYAQSISGPGVEVHQLVRLDLTGDLNAPVIHWADKASPAPSIGGINIAGSVTPDGSVAAYNGSIGHVTIGTDLNGHLIARNGAISSITVNGDMGSAGRPAITATAPTGTFAIEHLTVQGDIGRSGALADVAVGGTVRVIVADAIYANIDLENDPARPGFVAGLTTRAGNYTGLFRARSLTSFGGLSTAPCFVSIAGDLDGEIIFTNVIRNERAAGPEIDIAGRVLEGASIVVGAMPINNISMPASEIRVRTEQGLAGQIIVGRGPAEDFSGNAAVRIGTASPSVVTSNSKFDAIPYAEFGGGSVGIAPFNFHTTESWPKHNETIQLAHDDLLVAVAPRFFGPVFTDIGAQMIVEHLAPGEQVWTDRSGDFSVEASTSELGDRTIVVHAIAPASFTEGQWRMRPVDDTLLCAQAIRLPSVKFVSEYDDDTYRFNVEGGSDCPQPRPLSRTNENPVDFSDSDGIVKANCP